jgi:hypothetical protein
MWRWIVTAVSAVALVAIFFAAYLTEQSRQPAVDTSPGLRTTRVSSRPALPTQVSARPTMPDFSALTTIAASTPVVATTRPPASPTIPAPPASPIAISTPPSNTAVTPSPPAAASPASAPRSYLIANTGGQSIYIRLNPADPATRIRTWPEGATMVSAGAPDRQAEGRTWRNVRDPDGNVGWVAVDFLAPKP